ncbi:hypothetical protein ACS0TY_005257 [Phlomoides rotata]
MQADEDVGKIAMAVPLLVSKALELFLQDLCDRTYEVTKKSGAKTVNSLHLKQCVQSFNSFDFLKDVVNKVPDLGGSDGAAEEKSATKKRKISEDEDVNANVNDDDATKRIHVHVAGHVSSTGRGRGRPRGRPKGSRTLEREMAAAQYTKSEEAADSPHQKEENEKENFVGADSIAVATNSETTSEKDEDKPVRNFDLNVELNVNEDSTSAPTESSTKPDPDVNDEMSAIDPAEFANLNGGISEQDEDYDEE